MAFLHSLNTILHRNINKAYHVSERTAIFVSSIKKAPNYVQSLSSLLIDTKASLRMLDYAIIDNDEMSSMLEHEEDSLHSALCGCVRVCEEVYLVLKDHVDPTTESNTVLFKAFAWSWQAEKVLELAMEIKLYQVVLNKALVFTLHERTLRVRNRLNLDDRTLDTIDNLIKSISAPGWQVSIPGPPWFLMPDITNPKMSLRHCVDDAVTFLTTSLGRGTIINSRHGSQSTLSSDMDFEPHAMHVEHSLACKLDCHFSKELSVVDGVDTEIASDGAYDEMGGCYSIPTLGKTQKWRTAPFIAATDACTKPRLQRTTSVSGRLEGSSKHALAIMELPAMLVAGPPGKEGDEVLGSINPRMIQALILDQQVGTRDAGLDHFESWQASLVAVFKKAYDL